MVKEKFEPQSEQLINLLTHHAPNVVTLGAITSFLDISIDAVHPVVMLARAAIDKEGHRLNGKAEIKNLSGVGYRLIAKE